MENPFIITGRIKPEYFCDRKEEAKRIIATVTQGENIVVMAARRVGKSKLIEYCLDSSAVKDNFINISRQLLHRRPIDAIVAEGISTFLYLCTRNNNKYSYANRERTRTRECDSKVIAA